MSFKPEKGGPAAQAGIYFQNCITVLRLTDMLCKGHVPPLSSGRIISVRTEAPEEVDDTVVVWSSGCKEYVQAKLSISPGSNAWTKLWSHFYRQYRSSDFHRVPPGDMITLAVNWTPQVVDLKSSLTRARTAESEKEWIERLPQSHWKLLEDVRDLLEIDAETLFRFCRFVQVWLLTFEGDPMETDTFEQEISRKLHGVVEPTANAFSVLMDLVGRTARVRGTWEYSDVVAYLMQRNFRVRAPTTSLPPSDFRPLQPNPYIVGPPLRSPTDLFVGRDALMHEILWRVRKHTEDKLAPNAVLLYGPRRSGKTSVLLQLCHKLEAECRPMYVDLSGIYLARELPDVLAALADQMETPLILARVNVDIPSHDEFSKQPVKSMTKFMRGIVSACASQSPVLMLDESDALSSFADDQETVHSFLVFIRSLVEQNRDVFFIFASCRDIRWLADPRMSRLLTLADEYLRVDLLSEPETVALILDPANDYFTYTQDALTHIIDLSGRFPCFVQLICRQVVKWRNQQQVNLVPAEALSDVIPQAVAQGHHQFADLWSGLTQDEQMIVCALSYVLRDKARATLEEVRTQLTALKLHVADWDIAVDRVLHTGLISVQEGDLCLQLGLLKFWIYRTQMITLFPHLSIGKVLG